jgi:hypothetical protein
MLRSFGTIALLVAAFCTSCGRKLEPADLIGRYVSNRGAATDVVELRADGTYVHTFGIPGKPPFVNTNRWEFQYRKGEPRLTFWEFVFKSTKGPIGGPAIWDVEIERSRGRLRLCISPDLDHYYVKEHP